MTEGIHYSKELEAAILGVCMLESTAFGRTYGLIEPETFYVDDNGKIYEVLKDMSENSMPIDLLTVWEYLVSKDVKLNCIDGKGGLSYYLMQLTHNVVNSTHLEYHCHLIKKMWRKRELEKLTNSGFDPMEDEKKQIYQLNDRLQEILGSEVKQDWYTMDELIFKLMMHQSDIRNGKKKFVTTGFRAVDRENGGFSAGQMIIIGARPSVGKSALMGKMALSMAMAGKHIGIISLEMNNEEIAGRLASIDTDIEFYKIYRDLWQDENENRRFYEIVVNRTVGYPIYVSDKTKVDVNEIRAKAAKLKYKHSLDCLMIDYLQLVDGTTTNKNYNREQEVAKISRGLKLLAMDMQIPVIVLCQLNRDTTKQGGKDPYPKLQHLRESGSIEQDADVVMMLHRDWMAGIETDENGISTERQADLLGLKWRNGAQFHLKLDFDPQKMKFMEQLDSGLRQVVIPKDEPIDEPEPF